MKRPSFSKQLPGIAILLLGMIAAAGGPLSGQDENSSYPNRSSGSRALADADSRAEKEAERLVSLPAERIIELLQQEPGLLLQVKKMLVRKAYEQGRVLDRSDLRDDVLFRLIRQDEDTRILITHEIVDRNYIRAKPTREEMRRDQQQALAAATTRTNRVGEQDSQEQQYWAGRSRQSSQGAPQYSGPSVPVAPDRRIPPSSQPTETDPRRRLLEAQTDDSGVQTTGPGSFPSVDASQVAQLLNANPGRAAALISEASSGRSFDQSDINSVISQLKSSAQPPVNPPMPDLSAANDLPPYQIPPANFRSSTAPPMSTGGPRQDNPALQRRVNPYADVPSLYDLYSQYSRHSPVLSRFGIDVFENGTGNSEQLPMDLPVGPDYVVGTGDGLNIDLWGSVSQRLRQTVDRQGRITLPDVGAIEVAGRSLGEVQHVVQTALRTQFRQLDADVSLSRLRTIRIYVVGDVQRPGAYDVSSLSTPLNALYQAGGPTSRGSMRIVKHYRGKQLVEDVDLNDLLLHGVQAGTQHLQSGDTILVPPLGSEVTVQGMVRRPAIYELNGEKSLGEVLQLAGGVLPSGTLRHVDVERVEAHQSRTMLRLDIPEHNNQETVTKALEDFQVQDSDTIKISPILPVTDKSVYLDGHVFRPGKYAYSDGMKVTDLVKSYSDLLPEAYGRHAEIIRLKAPNNEPEVLAFSLDDSLQGKNQDLVLKPFDTVRIFGRFDFEEAPVVTVTGEVREPGDHVTNGATYLRDAIYLAGNTTADAELNDAQVFRRTEDGNLKVVSVNLQRALAGDARENILLQPTDRVFIHKSVSRVDPPTVTIQGEIPRPGTYPLGNEMMASDLVRLAGGLKRSAYAQQADLTRYEIEQGSRVASEHHNLPMDKALAGEPDADVRLRDGDVLTIGQIAGWNNIGATIAVQGEVAHPGTFGIEPGERLSDVLARAGGLSSDAYPYGAILQREQVRELEEKHRAELINDVHQQQTILKTAPEAMGQWRTTLQALQATSATGRLVIHVSGDVKRWAHTPADIPVRAGDVLFIPKRPHFVLVDGAVYSANAITFKPGRSALWYLRQAGGPTTAADKKNIFVVRADGSVAGGKNGLFAGSALDSVLQPGDMVMVPEKPLGGGAKWKQILQAAQMLSSVGAPLAPLAYTRF